MSRVLRQEARKMRMPAGRCTRSELLTIKLKAEQAGLSVSEYMRHMCVHGSVIERRPIADIELMTQLRRIGVNLNQYVKVLHVRGRETPERMNDLLDELAEILEAIRDGS